MKKKKKQENEKAEHQRKIPIIINKKKQEEQMKRIMIKTPQEKHFRAYRKINEDRTKGTAFCLFVVFLFFFCHP